MPYSVSEKNLERQRLLNKCLSPATDGLLDALQLPPRTRCLDLGCGIGETTRHLARRLGVSSEIVGLDLDPELIAVAKDTPLGVGAAISFQVGDAAQMQYGDESFDFVYARYFLPHFSEPEKLLAGMFRVCRLGGIVAVQEPDLSFHHCHPRSWAYERMADVCDKLFPNAFAGRGLAALFGQTGYPAAHIFIDSVIEVGGITSGSVFAGTKKLVEAYEGTELRRTYRLSMEAVGPALISGGHMGEEDVQAMCDEFERVEQDKDILCMGNPVVTAWAERS